MRAGARESESWFCFEGFLMSFWPPAKFRPEAVAEAPSAASALILERGRVGGEASLSQRCHFSSWFARVCKYLYINLCILLCHGGVFNVFVYSVYIKRKQNQSPLPCLQEIRPLNISSGLESGFSCQHCWVTHLFPARLPAFPT